MSYSTVLALLALVAAVEGTTFASTECQLTKDKKSHYLDRHRIGCPHENQMLAGWQMIKGCDKAGHRRFQTQCTAIPAGDLGECTVERTGCQSMKNRPLQYLDRHRPHCGHRRALKDWTVVADGCKAGDRRIEFTCCDVQRYEVEIPMVTECQKAKNQNIQYLDRHKVQCAEDAVLQQFTFTDAGCGDGDFRFAYTCVHALTSAPATSAPATTAPATTAPTTSAPATNAPLTPEQVLRLQLDARVSELPFMAVFLSDAAVIKGVGAGTQRVLETVPLRSVADLAFWVPFRKAAELAALAKDDATRHRTPRELELHELVNSKHDDKPISELIDSPVDYIHGIGKSTMKKLQKGNLHIQTVRELGEHPFFHTALRVLEAAYADTLAGLDKPHRQVPLSDVLEMSTDAVNGVGPVTQSVLESVQVRTVRDMARWAPWNKAFQIFIAAQSDLRRNESPESLHLLELVDSKAHDTQFADLVDQGSDVVEGIGKFTAGQLAKSNLFIKTVRDLALNKFFLTAVGVELFSFE